QRIRGHARLGLRAARAAARDQSLERELRGRTLLGARLAWRRAGPDPGGRDQTVQTWLRSHRAHDPQHPDGGSTGRCAYRARGVDARWKLVELSAAEARQRRTAA